jgi:hypothetical protein
MNYPEIIKSITDIVIAIFTAALFYATYVLTKHTKMLDAHEMEQKWKEEIRRCIFLAERIISPSQQEAESWYRGEFSSKSVHPFNELLALGKYFHDEDTWRALEYIASQFTTALLEPGNPMYRDKNLSDALPRFYPRLAQEIIEWQRDLGNYQRTEKAN